MTTQSNNQVQIKKELVLGYRNDIYNSILYVRRNEDGDEKSEKGKRTNVIQCAGHNLLNIEVSSAKKDNISIENGHEGVKQISCLSLSRDNRYIAVAYKADKIPFVQILDIEPKTREREGERAERKNFRHVKQLVSTDMKSSDEFKVVAFSPLMDKWIFTVGSTDKMVLLWQWDKQKILAKQEPDSSHSLIKEMRFNPQDQHLFSFLGDRHITLLEYKDGWLHRKEPSRKQSLSGFTTHCYFVDKNGETKIFVCSTTAEVYIFDKHCEYKNTARLHFPEKYKELEGVIVNRIFEYNKKLVAGCRGGVLLVLQSNPASKENPLEVFKGWALKDAHGESIGNVVEVAAAREASEGQAHLVLGTDSNQLINLQVDVKDKTTDDRKMEYMISENPRGAVLDLDICLFKKQVAVASNDKMVRIYSQLAGEVRQEAIIKEKFTEEPVSVAFHPSGINLIVAFKDKVKLFNIFRDSLQPFKDYVLKDVKIVRFSPSGRLFAVSTGNAIKVWDFWSGESHPHWQLKEHNGKIRSFKFYFDDTTLLSSDLLGVVIMWNLFPKPTREEDHNSVKLGKEMYTEKKEKIEDLEMTRDPETILTLCNGKLIKLIKDKSVKYELESEDTIGRIVIGHGQKYFFAGVAEDHKLGALRMQQFPGSTGELKGLGEQEEFQAHNKKLNCIRLAENGIDMLTSSEDGSLVQWKLLNTEMEADQLQRLKEAGSTQNEMVLMEKQEQEANVQQIKEQDDYLKKIKAETDQQLLNLQKHFDRDYSHKEKQLNDDIFDLRSKIDKIQGEIKSKENEFNAKKAKEKQAHEAELTGINDEWQKKISEEAARVEKLKQDKELKELRNREDSNELLARNQEAEERCARQQLEEQEAKRKMLDRVREEIKLVNEEHKKELDRMEGEQNNRLDQLQTKQKQERKTQQENLTNSHCQLLLTDDNRRKIELELSNVKVKNEKLLKDSENINSLLVERENQIEHITKEIEQRERAIQDKDETIEEEKRKNQELEKFKFVLNQKIEELKRDINPLEEELRQLQTQSLQMKTEIHHFEKVNSNLNLIVKDLTMKFEGLLNEKASLQKDINDMYAFKERFLDRLNDTYLKVKESSPVEVTEEGSKVHITSEFNKKLLKKEIIELYNTYANEQNLKGVLQTKEEKKRNERQFLEKSVDGLKNKMKTQRKGMNLENNKIMKENMYLISQINKLRKDLNQLHNENQELDTQINFNKPHTSADLTDKIASVEDQIRDEELKYNTIKQHHEKLANQFALN